MWESLGSWLVLLYAQTLTGPQSQAANSASGTLRVESPFTDFTAASVAWVLIIAVLVGVLLIGGLLVLNLGLMSKRPEDRIGKRTPSDVGILKENVWPEEAPELRLLPAEEEQDERAALAKKPQVGVPDQSKRRAS